MDIRVVDRESPDWLESLALSICDQGASSTGGRAMLDAFLDSVCLQKLDTTAVVSVVNDGRTIASCSVVSSPGKAGLILFGVRSGDYLPGDTARSLLEVLKDACRHVGVDLLQVLLAPYDTEKAALFRDAGFSYVAELSYQDCELGDAHASPVVARSLSYLTYSPTLEAAFIGALDASYKASLDCPALTGVRTTSDILQSHKHTGVFDPSLWFLIRDGDDHAGVLLMSEVVGRSALEIVYIGISPHARGCGLGDAMMELAYIQGKKRSISHLTTAVDNTNHYACQLYRRWGFSEIDRRRAWIARSSL